MSAIFLLLARFTSCNIEITLNNIQFIMTNTHRTPKQWCLTNIGKSIWKLEKKLLYTPSLDPNFAPLIYGQCHMCMG